MKTGTFLLLLSLIGAYHVARLTIHSVENNILTVEVYNLRNAVGTVRLTLFRSADGFPSEIKKAFRKASGKIKDGKCILVLDNLPSGEYAISVLHDENDNEKMDTRLMGIPKEGYGASNDAKVMLGPPKYEDARFVLNANQTIRIKMRYM